jgi:hypothetical protein
MFNTTGITEFEDFIPLIGLCTFIGIIFICCVCDKKKHLSNIRKLNNARYQSLTNDETDNNYNQYTENVENTRRFPKINFNNSNNSNNEQPPPYQHFS